MNAKFIQIILFSNFIILLSSVASNAQYLRADLSVPGVHQRDTINETGLSILPSGRYLSPAGKMVRITRDPFGMSISPDGLRAVTLHNGVFSLISLANLKVTRVPAYDKSILSPLSGSSFLGVAWAGDSKMIYLSGGDNGSVIVYDTQRMVLVESISLNGIVNGKSFIDSYTSDLVFNAASDELIVLDRGNFRLVRINLSTHKITASIPTGRLPFGLALSQDKKFAFVANVGLYSYALMPDITPENYNHKLLPWHPYGNNTPESIHGTTYKGRVVPGVGSPLAPEAMSLYSIDLLTNKVVDRFKTGLQIGQMIEGAEVVGGSSPNSVVVGSKLAYVTNATNDNISIINYKNHKISGTIPIHFAPELDHYRGLLPFGLCLSKDEKTLYVALLGANAIAVIDADTHKTRGLIPTGWGASRVQLSTDEKELYVISCRGLGAGPNGGKNFVAPIQGTYIGDIQLGSFQKIKTPDAVELAAYTKQVLANTFVAVGNKIGSLPPLKIKQVVKKLAQKNPINHIVYITKENRSYDEVFGQFKGANGDSTLARFGMHVTVTNRNDTMGNVNVMPNHHKLAKEFTLSDNFYCDGDASIHGHHWMMGVIPNEWVETNSATDATFKAFSPAPGRRSPRSTGSIDPEDYAEIGGLWENLDRHHVSFYNFGEANETGSNREDWDDTATGAGHATLVPMQKALYNRTSHDYAGFNTNIPDQYRMQQFEREFTRKWIRGKAVMPSLITMQVPNDHGADLRPRDGYPYLQSYMADNDLALGRILHFLSRTKYWKHMLVIVTEDDAQGGVDHTDAHRSILMMAGPYVRRGYVSHTHANFGSILKVIYNTLNLPYVNQYDATASVLNDYFTNKPDFSRYNLVFPDSRIFNPALSMKRYHKTIDWKKIEKGPDMDDEADMRKNHHAQFDRK